MTVPGRGMIWFKSGGYTGNDVLTRDRSVGSVSRRTRSTAVTKALVESSLFLKRGSSFMGFLTWPGKRILRTLRKIVSPFTLSADKYVYLTYNFSFASSSFSAGRLRFCSRNVVIYSDQRSLLRDRKSVV